MHYLKSCVFSDVNNLYIDYPTTGWNRTEPTPRTGALQMQHTEKNKRLLSLSVLKAHEIFMLQFIYDY